MTDYRTGAGNTKNEPGAYFSARKGMMRRTMMMRRRMKMMIIFP